MARNIFHTITQRGVNAAFMEAIGSAPNVWDTHTSKVDSQNASELYTWLGTVPQPRQHLGSRLWQQFNEFSFTVENNSYELSFIIDRDSMADDSLNAAQQRISQVAEVWANYKDVLFQAILAAGASSTDTFSGDAFYKDTHAIGQATAATLDNLLTYDATDHDAPTSAEVLTTLNNCLVALHRMVDDKDREGFNRQAMTRVRAIIKPEFERAFTEALESTQIGSSSNPWGLGLIEGFDVLSDIAAGTDIYYVNALGSPRGPFYYQQREPLEIVVLNGTDDVAENHGVKVLAYERFRFAYGDPRRSISQTLT
jgi:phage major head subunit gpT-like protein